MVVIDSIAWDWDALHEGRSIDDTTPRARAVGIAGGGFSLDNVDRKAGFAAQRNRIPLVITVISSDGKRTVLRFQRDTDVTLSEQISEVLPDPPPPVDTVQEIDTGRRYLIGKPGWVRTVETDPKGRTTDYQSRKLVVRSLGALRQRKDGSIWYRSTGPTGRPSWKKYKP